MILNLLPFLAVAPAAVYALISLWCGYTYFHGQRIAKGRKDREDAPLPVAVTILKPVKGMDAGSYENFASFCQQEYPGVLQIIFSTASPEDPVIPVIHRLILEYPDLDISLVINPAIHGPNYKVSSLINAFMQAHHDIIIVCDSDIRVTPGYLSSVTDHFSDPKVGLVTSLYRTSDVNSVAAAVEATGFTAEMIPNVMVALQLEGLSFALGASMAVRRQALKDIGGFHALADYLADDYQLGNKIHRAGWKIALDSCFVESILHPESLTSVLARQLRWARTMRVSRPGGYCASGITLPFLGAFAAACVSPTLPLGVIAIGLLYLVRCLVVLIFSISFVRDKLFPRWFWLLPLRDMLSFCSWALSFLGNRVEWRGIRFRLSPGGKIEEIV